jgi:hypothetical protein
VGDEDDRLPQPVEELAEFEPELGPTPLVEVGERLVEEEEARLGGERAGEGHPLALAAGELGHPPPPEACQAHPLQGRLGPARTRPAPGALLEPVGDVCRAPCGGGEEGVVLEDEAHAAPLGREVGHLPPADEDRPPSGCSSPAAQPEQVDLPQPDGPSTARVLPRPHSSVTASTAGLGHPVGLGDALEREGDPDGEGATPP